MAVSIIGAVLNAAGFASRLSAAFVVLGVAVLLAIGISALALGGGDRAARA